MAGSYNHATHHDDYDERPEGGRDGRLRHWTTFTDMVENLGDAYETVEEMYGMIHVLAERLESTGAGDRSALIEQARHDYPRGVALGGVGPARKAPPPRRDNLWPYR